MINTYLFLGVYLDAIPLLNSGNLNNYRDNGKYFLNTPVDISNCPTGQPRSFLIVYHCSSYVGQILFEQYGKIYWRWGTYSGTFTSWHVHTPTEITT